VDELRGDGSRIQRERESYRHDQSGDERREQQNPIPLPHTVGVTSSDVPRVDRRVSLHFATRGRAIQE
jgi:hypothetical protein